MINVAPFVPPGIGNNDQLLGVEHTGTLLEYKTLVAGTGISISFAQGQITISSNGGGGSALWGAITGTLANQTDLQTALNAKQNSLTIGNITVGTGLSVSGGTGAIIGSGVMISLGTAVVTSVVNDSNITGSITSNALTLGWSGQLSAARGGTGVNAAAATNGQLLIGNGTGFSLATLTAGSGITITNGVGTITITATGGGSGTVTSVTSANGDISVVNTTTTPVLTLNSSSTPSAGKAVKYDSNANLETNNIATTIVSKTANYTLTITDHTVEFDTTSGPLTATLPPAATATGLEFVVSIVNGSNSLTLAANGTEKINGTNSWTINNIGSALSAKSDGTGWTFT